MRESQPTSDVEDAAALASMLHADRYRAVEPAAQELHDRSRDRLTTEEVNLDTGGEFGGALIGAAVRLFSGADERREEEPNVVAPG